MNLIGLAELAELYGVSKNTANTWARRHDWPKPVANLRMGPVWDRDEVVAHRPLEANHRRATEINCAHCGGGLSQPLSSGLTFTSKCIETACGRVTRISIWAGDLDLGLFVHTQKEAQ